MKKSVFIIFCAFFSLLLPVSCKQKAKSKVSFEGATLNSLSPKQYDEFNRMIFEQTIRDPHDSGEQAKHILIGMLGLEKRPESHGIFEIDINFNVNAMLLLVANANKIKRESEFVEEFGRQMSNTRRQLKNEDQRTYFDVMTLLLLSEQSKL